MAENQTVPDQPDGIESDSFDLPPPANAARRVGEYLEWWGDGLIDAAGPNAHTPAAPLYARDLQALVNSARDRDLLLWLHAEAVWQRDEHEKTMREFASGGVSRLADYLSAQLEASRVECSRLRREVEFEANGANTFAGADAIAEQGEIGAAFVAEHFGLDVDYKAGGVYVSLNHSPVARTEAWGEDVNVDYDADGTPTGVEILRPPASRPVCSVHPEPCPAHGAHPHQGMKCLDCPTCTVTPPRWVSHPDTRVRHWIANGTGVAACGARLIVGDWREEEAGVGRCIACGDASVHPDGA